MIEGLGSKRLDGTEVDYLTPGRLHQQRSLLIDTVAFDVQTKLAIYTHFAETGCRPSLRAIADRVESDADSVLASFQRLAAQRLLVLDSDGESVRMASPFSGVPTQHVVISDQRQYFANCAWDGLGIVAALQKSATVYSRCEQSLDPYRLEVGPEGPEASDWLFHSLVPAAHWWDDIVFT